MQDTNNGNIQNNLNLQNLSREQKVALAQQKLSTMSQAQQDDNSSQDGSHNDFPIFGGIGSALGNIGRFADQNFSQAPIGGNIDIKNQFGQNDTRDAVSKTVGAIPILGGALGLAGDFGRALGSGLTSVASDVVPFGMSIGNFASGQGFQPSTRGTILSNVINPQFTNPFDESANAFSSPNNYNLGKTAGFYNDAINSGFNLGADLISNPTNKIDALGELSKIPEFAKGVIGANDASKSLDSLPEVFNQFHPDNVINQSGVVNDVANTSGELSDAFNQFHPDNVLQSNTQPAFLKAQQKNFRMIPPEEVNTMNDYVDYVRSGQAKTNPNLALEAEASRIAENHGIPVNYNAPTPPTIQLANKFRDTLASNEQQYGNPNYLKMNDSNLVDNLNESSDNNLINNQNNGQQTETKEGLSNSTGGQNGIGEFSPTTYSGANVGTMETGLSHSLQSRLSQLQSEGLKGIGNYERDGSNQGLDLSNSISPKRAIEFINSNLHNSGIKNSLDYLKSIGYPKDSLGMLDKALSVPNIEQRIQNLQLVNPEWGASGAFHAPNKTLYLPHDMVTKDDYLDTIVHELGHAHFDSKTANLIDRNIQADPKLLSHFIIDIYNGHPNDSFFYLKNSLKLSEKSLNPEEYENIKSFLNSNLNNVAIKQYMDAGLDNKNFEDTLKQYYDMLPEEGKKLLQTEVYAEATNHASLGLLNDGELKDKIIENFKNPSGESQDINGMIYKKNRAEVPNDRPQGSAQRQKDFNPDDFFNSLDKVETSPKKEMPTAEDQIQARDTGNNVRGDNYASQKGFAGKMRERFEPMNNLDDNAKELLQDWINERNYGKFAKEQLGKQFREVNKAIDKQGIEGLKAYEANPNIAPQVKKYYENALNRAKAGGLDVRKFKNYLNHEYADSAETISERIGKTINPHATFQNERQLPSYAEGEKLGLTPKYNTLTEHMQSYEAKLQKALADQKLMNDGVKKGYIQPTSNTPPDGNWKPLNQEKLPKIKTQYQDEQGMYHTGTGTYSAIAPIADRINNEVDDVIKPLEKIAEFNNKLKSSMLSGGIPFTAFNGHIMNGINRAVLSAKNPFEAFGRAMAWSTIPHIAGKFLENPENRLDQFVKNGFKFSDESKAFSTIATNFKEGNFKQRVGTVGDVWNKAFHDPLFNKTLPAFKLHFANEIYDSARKYLPEKQAYAYASKLANERFGGINYALLGRNKNFQNTLKSVFLASDWGETNVRLGKGIIQGLTTQAKNPEFASYRLYARNALGAATMLVVANKVISGKFPWENGAGHTMELDTGQKDSTGKEIFFRPFNTAFDAVNVPLQIASGIAENKPQNIASTVSNRLSPILGLGLKTLSHTDQYGRQLKTFADYAGMAGQSFLPQYGQGLSDLARGKSSPEQALSQGLGLPIRFSKSTGANQQTGQATHYFGSPNAQSSMSSTQTSVSQPSQRLPIANQNTQAIQSQLSQPINRISSDVRNANNTSPIMPLSSMPQSAGAILKNPKVRKQIKATAKLYKEGKINRKQAHQILRRVLK